MLYEMIERKTLYQECVRRECVRDKCPDASKFFNQFPLNNEAAELIKYMTQWNPQSRLNTMEYAQFPTPALYMHFTNLSPLPES